MIVEKIIVYPLIALVLVLGATAGWQAWTISGLKGSLKTESEAHALTKATYIAAAADAIKQNRTIEHELQTVREVAENARLEERSNSDATGRAFVRDHERLRDEIAEYFGPGGRGTAAATCTAARDRAAAAGVLLEIYVRADGESAAQLESQAADIRSLLSYANAVHSALNGPEK